MSANSMARHGKPRLENIFSAFLLKCFVQWSYILVLSIWGVIGSNSGLQQGINPKNASLFVCVLHSGSQGRKRRHFWRDSWWCRVHGLLLICPFAPISQIKSKTSWVLDRFASAQTLKLAIAAREPKIAKWTWESLRVDRRTEPWWWCAGILACIVEKHFFALSALFKSEFRTL